MTKPWKGWEVIYSDYWALQFSQLTRRRIPYSTEVAEETMQEVRQELALKLHELEHAPHHINSYLRTAFRNMLEDYLRKQDGYPRPPQWILRLGAAYERIYKLLCLERRAVQEIQALMESIYQYTHEFVNKIVSEVRAGVVNCGTWRESVPIDQVQAEVESNENQNDTFAGNPESILAAMDVDALIAAILGSQYENDGQLSPSSLLEKALIALHDCPLNDDERILLRLIYTDGHSVAKAARILKQSDSEARKLLKSILHRLREFLDKAGIQL